MSRRLDGFPKIGLRWGRRALPPTERADARVKRHQELADQFSMSPDTSREPRSLDVVHNGDSPPLCDSLDDSLDQIIEHESPAQPCNRDKSEFGTDDRRPRDPCDSAALSNHPKPVRMFRWQASAAVSGLA